jgi:hypothetical protein
VYEKVVVTLAQRKIAIAECVFIDSSGKEMALSDTLMTHDVPDRLLLVNYRGMAHLCLSIPFPFWFSRSRH